MFQFLGAQVTTKALKSIYSTVNEILTIDKVRTAPQRALVCGPGFSKWCSRSLWKSFLSFFLRIIFSFKKYILHVLVINQQHWIIYIIYWGQISYSINCLYVYIVQMYLDHHRWSNNKDKALKSFIPSLSWAHLFFNVNFILNWSEHFKKSILLELDNFWI